MNMEYYKRLEPFFGSWHITKLIGEGSFGKVFKIERQDFGETYQAAIKVITVPQSASEVKSVMASGMDKADVTEYFEGIVKDIISEFVLMSKLKGNSHIVSYEDHQVIPHEGKLGWDILIRMELLTPLLDYAQTNELTRKDVIKLGINMCDALELCQRRNIIHRDIKPENIFVSEDGHFKLGDFGIARTIEKTSSGLSKKGTYTYMAPEVYKGEEYGSSVDIYSLGIVMYRLLNGNRTPFLPAHPKKIKHSDVDKALVLRMGGEIPLPPTGAEGRLAEIVMKACAYKSNDRYSSPMQMRSELEAILYETAESKIIYPQGDKVVVQPNEYALTDEKENIKNSYTNEDTVSLFSDVPQPEVTQNDEIGKKVEGVTQEEEVPQESESEKIESLAHKESLRQHRDLMQSLAEKPTWPTEENSNKTYLIVAIILAVIFLGVIWFVISSCYTPSGSVLPSEEITSEITVEIEIAEFGTIIVQLDPTYAPITVENFVQLVESGFYDGLTFHRIIGGFMIQGGCNLGTGTGGSSEQIVGEFAANGIENPLSHTRGVLSMARLGHDYNSASSQFFIMHEDSPFLDGEYASFGWVTDGMEVIDEIVRVTPVGANGATAPENQPIITAIRIAR